MNRKLLVRRIWVVAGVVLFVILVALTRTCPVSAPSEPVEIEHMPSEEYLALTHTNEGETTRYIFMEANQLFPEWRTGIAGVDGVVYCDSNSDTPTYLTPFGVEGRNCSALTSEEGARVQLLETDSQNHQLVSLQGSMQVVDGGVWVKSTIMLQPGFYQIKIWYWRGMVRLNDATDALRLNYTP